MSSNKKIKINHRLSEGIFIITIAFAIFLLISLLTYHVSDPSWSNITNSGHVSNLGGRVGAWIADVLLSLIGYMGYLLPVLLIYGTWTPLRNDPNQLTTSIRQDNNFNIKILGLILALTSGSGLTSLYLPDGFLPVGAGGIIGDMINHFMISILSTFGAGLLMLGLFLAALTLFCGVSWLHIVDIIGCQFCQMLSRKDPRKDISTNAQRSEKNSKKVEKRIEPKVDVNDFDKIPQAITANINDDSSSYSLRKTKFKPENYNIISDIDVKPKVSNDVEDYIRPSLELLDLPQEKEKIGYSEEYLASLAKSIESHLRDFGIDVQVTSIHPGPVVTRFELQLAAGTKVSRITGLSKDLARSLSVLSVRIVEIIQGKSVIGLEIPNDTREIIKLREILASKNYQNSHAPLAIALGKDISGNPVVVDLTKMPHLLVAGTTGSGKSVGLNAILLSLLYKYSPKDVRLLLIDPKMLELSVYEGIPHLIAPVVTDMKEASNALRWCVIEMDRRYRLMAALGVRNIVGYNAKIIEAAQKNEKLLDPLWREGMPEERKELNELPYVVVLADEFADMIMVVGKKIEELITRIAQKARAAGIHLILATQRPSVDVITGLIKANIPSRIAFQVSSKIDSRTILDQMGAEQLLGNGDMLYMPSGTSLPLRVHGAFVADDEVHRVAEDLRRNGSPVYVADILDNDLAIPGVDQTNSDTELEDAEQDPLYDQAVQLVIETRKASTSSIQRRFKIGYNRAARIVEAMEFAGVVSAMESNGNREVLVGSREE